MCHVQSETSFLTSCLLVCALNPIQKSRCILNFKKLQMISFLNRPLLTRLRKVYEDRVLLWSYVRLTQSVCGRLMGFHMGVWCPHHINWLVIDDIFVKGYKPK